MTILEKKTGWYWGKAGPFENEIIARKVGARKFIRGEDDLAQDDKCLDDISEDELREAWSKLVKLQGEKKIKQEDAEILAGVITSELINRNQAGNQPKEANTNIQTDDGSLGKSEVKPQGCLSCTDSHWATVSGILNEAVRLARQGFALDNKEITSRIALAKEEIASWERYDASADKIENSDDFVKDVIRKMSKKGAELRHLMLMVGSIDDLEKCASFSRQAFNEFEKDLNANGVCLIDKGQQAIDNVPEEAKYPSSVIAEDKLKDIPVPKKNPDDAFAPASATTAMDKELNPGEKPNPDQPKGPVTGKTMESTGMNQALKALVIAKANATSGMHRYEIAIGPITKGQAIALEIRSPGDHLELLSKEEINSQIESLLAGSMTTSHLILQAQLAKAKVSKNEAGYVETSTSSDRCATCKAFVKKEGPSDPAKDSGSCVKVIGPISPKGRCNLFSRGWGPARAPETGQVRLEKAILTPNALKASNAVEFNGQYYLRLSQTVCTKLDIPVGEVVEISLGIVDIDKGQFLTLLPQVGNRLEKAEPSKLESLITLSAKPIGGYASKRIGEARMLYDNDMVREAIELLNSEIAKASEQTDRGTIELWEQYRGALQHIQKGMQERIPDIVSKLRVADEIYKEGQRSMMTTKEGDSGAGIATVESTGFTPTFGGDGKKKIHDPLDKEGESGSVGEKAPLTTVIVNKKVTKEDIIYELAKRGVLIQKAPDINLTVKAVIRDGSKMLILKDTYSDYWDLPGGHVKQNEKLEDALGREVKEETGLNIADPITFMTKVMKLGNKEKPVIFYEATATGNIKLSSEHTDFKWIEPDEVKDYNLGQFSSVLTREYDADPNDKTPPIKKQDDEPMDLEKEYLPQYSQKGLSVYGVNGDFVRLIYDVDFTEDGHDLVYPEYVPHGEAWLDNANRKEWDAIFIHSLTERNQMANGVEYDHAHNYASQWELVARANPSVARELIDEQYSLMSPVDDVPSVREDNEMPHRGVEITPEDRLTQMTKAFSQEGKILVDKPITRGGATFHQKFWVTPEQAKQLGLKPIEGVHTANVPTEAPKHVGRGRPTTAEQVMDLPHTVATHIEDPDGAEELWSKAAEEAVKTPEGVAYESRIRNAQSVGALAIREIGHECEGFFLTSKHITQGALAYKNMGNHISVENLASATWNFPTSKDPRRVTGVGSRLLAELFTTVLENKKIETVRLTAIRESVDFYKKAGFIESQKVWIIDRKGMEGFLKRLENE